MFKKVNNSLKSEDRFAKEKFSVGLDIGTSVVKMIRLKFLKGSGVELCGFDLEPIQTNLEPFLKRILPSQNITISISGPQTVIRYVNFPTMNANELKQALKFEAQKHIPFPISEVTLDSCILKQSTQDNKMLVLVAAVKKEFVNQRLKLMEKAGLKINIVDIDSLALLNAFNFNYSYESDDALKNKIVALLNIGASVSNLDILDNGLPVLSRDIPIAGNNFTQKIVDVLGIDFKSAEDLKLNPDDKDKLDKVSQAVESMLSNLAGEIRNSFDYYESQSASSVVKIFLSGGSSLFGSLKDKLANYLDIGIEYWDPFKQISISDSVDSKKIKALSNQFAVAVGLALHS